MKLSTKKALGMAVSGAILSGSLLSPAFANTYTWNSTTSSDWGTAANWSPNTVPGQADTAFFKSVIPTTNTVTLAGNYSVGAILDESSHNLTISGNTLTAYGQSLNVPTLTGTVSFSNVVLAAGSAVGTNTVTVTSTLGLENAQNVMVGSATSGLSSGDQTILMNDTIDNATSTAAALTLNGGGSISNYGAVFEFGGTNSYTGGLTIGNTSGSQGATGEFLASSDFPTTGNITVNEQSQLLLETNGSYGNSGQTLFLNGGGVGPGDSSGSSGALRNGSKTQVTFNPNIVVGTNTTGTHASGFVVITSASASGGLITLTGGISGTGSIQKQGGGILTFDNSSNTWSGGTQVGNGVVETTATTSLGTGDLSFAASQVSNTTTVDLFNPTQSVRNLFSTYAGESGSDSQLLNLYGTTLTINATQNNAFGYGPYSTAGTLSSTIADGTTGVHGSIVYSGASGTTLSLTGPNTYSGGTTITGGTLNLANVSSGSATGTGNVEIKSGGELSSGGGVPQFQSNSTLATSGSLSGALTVDSGGILAPGGNGLVGSLTVGDGVTAHSGSVFDFDLAGGTSASNSELIIANNDALTLDSGGTVDVNITGSQLATGTYTLATYGSIVNSSATSFDLTSDPAGTGRTYSLSTTGSSSSAGALLLSIINNGTQYYWSVNGVSPAVDGSGTWAVGSNNFFSTSGSTTTSPSPYANGTTNPVIIGNNGAGGTITVTGSVSVGGGLVFSQVSSGYTIAGTNTITLTGGIVDSATPTGAPSPLTTSITAPIVLTGSENFQASANNVLSVSGGVGDGGHGYTLTVGGDVGTVILGGTNTYSGGTIITSGVLETATGSLPGAGGVQINNSSAALVFNQTTSGSYSGSISGNGNVAVNNSSPTATVALTNSANSYSGLTEIQSGVLSISAPGNIDSGAGGISLQGGTLQFASSMSFGTGSELLNTASGTSTLDTDGNNVTLGFSLNGAGGNLTKIGGGTLTFTGIQPTTATGTLSVTGGTLAFNTFNAFSFAAPSTPGGFTGDLVLEGGGNIRLQGGDINGGGTVWMNTNGESLVAQGPTEIDNNIVLNGNSDPSPFVVDIAANAGNTLTITGVISGDSDVDFTGGAGVVMLENQNTYDGPTAGGGSTTTIDNGAAGEIQLDVNNALPTTTNVHLTSSGVLDIYGVTQTVGSIDSGAPGTLATVTNNSNNNALLIIDGSKSTNFSGVIEDSFTAASSPGGMLGLELGSAYTGTLTLNYPASNTYSGGTILNGGTLLLGTIGDGLLGSVGFESGGVYSPTGPGTPVGGVTFGGGTLLLSSQWASSRALTVNTGTSTINGAGNSVSLTPAALTWSGGTLNIQNAGASSITTSSSTTVAVTAPGSALGVDQNTTLAVSGPVDPFAVHNTTIVPASSAVALIDNGTVSITGGTTTNGVEGLPTVSIGGITGTGTLSVGNGSSGSVVQLASNSGGSALNSLVINANSVLDITNNHLIINYGSGSDPMSTIYSYLKSGYNNGKWNGTGIISSSAQTKTNSLSYGIGFSDGADEINGHPIVTGLSSGQIELKYTLLGDANLDGTVNGSDFSILAANFGQGYSNWDQGNFEYTPAVNGTDFSALAANFGQGDSGADTSITTADIQALDAFAAANGLPIPTITAVPEPASVGLLALGAVGILARRRRRRAQATH